MKTLIYGQLDHGYSTFNTLKLAQNHPYANITPVSNPLPQNKYLIVC